MGFGKVVGGTHHRPTLRKHLQLPNWANVCIRDRLFMSHKGHSHTDSQQHQHPSGSPSPKSFFNPLIPTTSQHDNSTPQPSDQATSRDPPTIHVKLQKPQPHSHTQLLPIAPQLFSLLFYVNRTRGKPPLDLLTPNHTKVNPPATTIFSPKYHEKNKRCFRWTPQLFPNFHLTKHLIVHKPPNISSNLHIPAPQHIKNNTKKMTLIF